MTIPPRRFLLATLVLLAPATVHAAPTSAEPTRALLAKYCVGCHGPEKTKGDIRLDDLPSDIAKDTDRWRAVLKRLDDRTMPPKAKPAPADQERQTAINWVVDGLKVAQAESKARDGRAMLRRLNRAEYSNTLRDLLGIHTDLGPMLPEDDSASGFDNVDSALGLSPVLLELYLEAANAALREAIGPDKRPETLRKRFQMKEIFANHITGGNYVGSTDDALVLFHGTNYVTTAAVNELYKMPAGRYRMKISAYAVRTEAPILMQVFAGNFGTSPQFDTRPRWLDVFEIGTKPTEVEFEEWLSPHSSTIKPVPYGLRGPIPPAPGSAAKFEGPGLAVQWLEVAGPLFDTWPLTSRLRLLGEVDPKQATKDDADRLLADFLPRAFRRPVGDEERRRYTKLAQAQMEQGKSFEAAMRLAYQSILCSPHFLFLQEKPGPLDDFALASRLSYFLWSSMPDQALLDLAARKELKKPAILDAQVERMLKDPKAAAFTHNFTDQWLRLRDIDATVPDSKLYPEFDEYLQSSMLREAHLFFDEILKNDRSCLEFVDSDWTYLDGRLARHYGIPDVKGIEFRKVPLKPEYHRGGVMTQASVLKVTANGTNTSPVVRGAWILNKIIGKPAPPPPPNVPAVEPDIRGATTIREQLAKHRSVESCGTCHARIDPPGFALENFDVIGGWRENYRVTTPGKGRQGLQVLCRDGVERRVSLGPKVEAADVLENGKTFHDITEFKARLLDDKDQIARSLAEKLLVYATGHAVEATDRPAVEDVVRQARANGYKFRSMIHTLVHSPPFLEK
jgi:cytochrome c553